MSSRRSIQILEKLRISEIWSGFGVCLCLADHDTRLNHLLRLVDEIPSMGTGAINRGCPNETYVQSINCDLREMDERLAARILPRT